MAPQSAIAHYKITAKLGAGGMGEVWRATDTKLGREVAIKILPDSFASDPERLARFGREARVLASLNHPNIAAIYGVEERALVMELVEGESPKGPLPFDEAWKIAMQIATALDYAHERGIVHRDLKPASVKVTPDGVVKLLDFGLAKAFSDAPEGPDSDPVNSPTITLGATAVGRVMGTAAYMAPEQAKGKRVDKRADIWSWGVMLYELITGDRMFRGDDAADTLAQVLTKEPDLSRVPEKMRRLLAMCLAKDPKQRLRDIGDARALLEEGHAPEAKPRTSAWRYVVAAAVLIALISASILFVRTQPPLRPMLRFTDDLGMDGPPSEIALSPDGTRLAFVGPDQRLYVRFLNNPKPTLLGGVDGATVPFFSPDGDWIGFASGGRLKKIAVQGGSPIALADGLYTLGASWGDDHRIIFTPTSRNGLSRVPDSGGKTEQISDFDPHKPKADRWAQVLPGDNAVLFSSGTPGDFEQSDIVVQILKSGERKTIHPGGYHARYLPSGHLIYLHEGTLFATPMDLKRLELTGPPVPMLDDVTAAPTSGDARFDFSQSGTFAYVPSAPSQILSLAWLDSSGKLQAMAAQPKAYVLPFLVSPDGARLALAIQEGPVRNLWVYDWKRDRLFPVTFIKGVANVGAWSPDGKHLAFTTSGTGLSGPGIYWVRTDGGGKPELLVSRPANSALSRGAFSQMSFSPDGKRLAFNEEAALKTVDLELSDADHPKPGKPELSPLGLGSNPAFSPDGKWIAFTSTESGRSEVYVAAFPAAGGKWLVSNGGGLLPVWAQNGRDLFYQSIVNRGRIMIIHYTARDGSFDADPARVWVDREFPPGSVGLAPDGRIAVAIPAGGEQKQQSQVVFLLNFFDELKRRAPGK